MSEAVIKLTIESLRLQTIDLSFEDKAKILTEVAKSLAIDSVTATSNVSEHSNVVDNKRQELVSEIMGEIAANIPRNDSQTSTNSQYELCWEKKLTDDELEERTLQVLKEDGGELAGTEIYKRMNFKNTTKSSPRFRKILKGLVELDLIRHNGGATRSSRYFYVEKPVKEKPNLQIVS